MVCEGEIDTGPADQVCPTRTVRDAGSTAFESPALTW
jgi:hypothetical protein